MFTNYRSLINIHAYRARGVSLVAGVLALGACNTASAPRETRAVEFHLSAATAAAGSPAAATQDLTITGIRLVAGYVALGNGSQYGCVDCQDNGGDVGGGSASGGTQQLINVPLDGSSAVVRTEQVTVGTYGSAEISLERPRGTLAGASGWPAGNSLVVDGSYRGTAFQLPLSMEGSFRETLNPPVTVAAGAASPSTVQVRITLPVASWFAANGASLDPATAAGRAQIEANARASLQPAEAGEAPESGSEREP